MRRVKIVMRGADGSTEVLGSFIRDEKGKTYPEPPYKTLARSVPPVNGRPDLGSLVGASYDGVKFEFMVEMGGTPRVISDLIKWYAAES